MVSEVLSVEKCGSTSGKVDISTGETTVSLGVERSSFPTTVDTGVILSSKVESLNSGSLATDVVPETMEKLANHGDVKLDRDVVYLSIMAPVVIILSVVVVASCSVDASGWIIISVIVDECSMLGVLPWNADVNRVWSGLEVQVTSVVNRWAPSSLIDVGPDSDALDVEADLVEIKENTFLPHVGVFWVYTGPETVGGSIFSAAVGASVIPGVKALYVVSASKTVCTL